MSVAYEELLSRLSRRPKEDFLQLMILLALLPGINDYSLFLIDFGYPPGGSVLYTIVVSLALLGLPLAYIICRDRKYWHPLLRMLPLLLLWLTWILPNPLFRELFQLSGPLAYGWFLYEGGVRKRMFWVFLAIVWLSLGMLHLALFLGVTLMIRFVIILVSQNWRTVARLGWSKFILGAGLALLLWSPMLLVVVPSYYFTEMLEQKAAEGVYNFTFLNDYTHLSHFEVDLDKSLDSLQSRMKIQAHRKVDSLRQASADVAAAAPDVVGDLIRNSIVPPKVKKIDLDCAWWRLDCHAAQGAARAASAAASDAFRETGRKLADDTERRLDGFMRQGDKSAEEKLADLDAEIDRQIEQTRSETESTTLNSYRLLLLFLFLSEIGFFFVVLKSYTYVLARVLFSSDKGNTFATLAETELPMAHGKISLQGANYRIADSERGHYFVSRRFEPAGRAPKIALPQWHVGMVGRILSGTWAMNRLIMEAGRPAVDFNAAIGIEFVEWELAEGESVIFSLSDFVAMSGEVKLKRIVSLRMESMLLGKMFFTAATGPGKLILRSKGNVLLEGTSGDKVGPSTSVPQHRILAWQQHTRFLVESELNVLDVFFSGVYLRPMDGDPTVINSDQTGKARSGIGRFFWHFLLPN
ncbi:hypothetical protein CEQ90_12000 [Lewinellaceae bacterium SD302]|nr:hypothetical protein CEQ90_12000 [Lewinellaceae bacterium SD302]